MSILSTSNFRKCLVFVENVSELRFNKVKSRLVNKFNNLLHKKEGHITWEASQGTRAIRVVTISLQAGRQPPFPGTVLLPRKPVQSMLTALLPGKAAPTVIFPRKEAIPPLLTHTILGLRQVTAAFLLRQLGRQATPFPRTALLPRKPAQSTLTALLPGKAMLTALFPRKEAILPLLTQAILGLRQVTAQILPRQSGT